MQRIILCVSLLCLGLMARGQADYEYAYWWDDNVASGRILTVQGDSWHTDVDVSFLNDGIHSMHVQVRDTAGVWSSPLTRYFLKQSYVESGMTCRYWFDCDKNMMKTDDLELTWLDVSMLSDGLHVLHVMIDGEKPSSTLSHQFIKISQVSDVDYVVCHCFIDGERHLTEKVSAEGGLVNLTLDVSQLSLGVHHIMVLVELPNGETTALQHGMFVSVPTNEEIASMECYYMIDGKDVYTEAGEFDNGMFHVDLDVSLLDEGLHQISCLLVSDNGAVVNMNTAWFIKTPIGGNGITKYEYWLNNNYAEKQVKAFGEHVELYQLIELLPVESVPIRSSLFHFEVDEEQGPMVYAKNEFHIRFYDATGRLVDATNPYLDYNVSEKVTGMEEIKKTQTFARPAENGIKWFILQACEGDTIAFRSSQALSLQVFSPSGKELYAASGAESVKWGGCHTWEEGTHYVAVHDVAGSQPNVTLDYLHMDKYDVVDQNVRVVGNGGCSTITFYGNGFSDLYAVDLVNASGDTIHCGYINHVSDATIETIFDFYGADLSEYHGVFYFTEEMRKVESVVLVEDAKDILLVSKVSYPNQYLRNTTITYNLKVENLGNMTAYRVPLYVYIASRTEDGITKIDIDGLNLPKLLDGLDRDSIPNEWLEYEERIGDGHYFITSEGYDEDLRDSAIIRSAYFFVDVAPQSAKSISLTLHANEYVNVLFTLPKDVAAMSAQNVIPQKAPSRVNRASMKEHYCCIRERVECIGGLIGDVVGFANTIGSLTGIPHAKALAIADCGVGTLNTVISAAGEVACGENDVEASFYEKLKKIKDGISISGTIVSCFEKFLKGSELLKIGDLSAFIGTATHATTWADCAIAFSEKKPNCPPNSGGGGGGSEPVNSWDPNEIYGYISPSGSLFIAKDSVETIDYRIEFENDTAFATSAAHVVEIRDTLDVRFFELGTFAPTYFNIGDKREQLDGTPNFVRTVDMRPQINTVVQVEGQYNEQTGIARWLFTSLDPMTMEPTDDVMQGFLPVNHDGTSGIGDVGYRIGLKKGLADGAEITNRASIVFDSNEPILTPTWTNIVDGVCPESRVADVAYKNDSVVTLSIEGSDERSGIWKYDLYVQYGVGAPWIKEAELAADSTEVDFRIYDGLYYGFCTLATDSAGNVEQKVLQPEVMCAEIHLGDVNSDGVVNEQDAQLTMDYYLEKPVAMLAAAADVNEDGVVNTLDVTLIVQMYMDSENSTESAPVVKHYYTIRR